MLYGASSFRQDLHIWLIWVNKAPHSKYWCDFAVCDASVAPTSMPSIVPSTSSPVTSSMTPSAAPTENKNNCDHKSKNACKKFKDACVFGKSKIFGACKPKNSSNMHNCASYDDEESCTDDENHGGLCKFINYACLHVCDDLNEKHCKKLRNTKNNKKTCKPKKIRNPCKGCQHKTTCG